MIRSRFGPSAGDCTQPAPPRPKGETNANLIPRQRPSGRASPTTGTGQFSSRRQSMTAGVVGVTLGPAAQRGQPVETAALCGIRESLKTRRSGHQNDIPHSIIHHPTTTPHLTRRHTLSSPHRRKLPPQLRTTAPLPRHIMSNPQQDPELIRQWMSQNLMSSAAPAGPQSAYPPFDPRMLGTSAANGELRAWSAVQSAANQRRALIAGGQYTQGQQHPPPNQPKR
ncbi:hypothetical protein EDC01DRAFT_632629 [Geopyxis carbonaria]|nr:hypothetical protein EDC01DRAFT_632629 [Geopyxis carbonaria]